MEAGNTDERRDFLHEAARLALQLDPLAWEFDLSERQGQAAAPHPGSGFQQVVPDSFLDEKSGAFMTSHPAPWTSQSASPYSHPDIEGGNQDACDIGDNLKMLGPRFYENSFGGSMPARLDRDLLRHRPATTDGVYMDQMDQLNAKQGWSGLGQSQSDPLSSWQFPQTFSTWSDGAKAETAQNDDASEAAALRAELAKVKAEKEQLENHSKILEQALMTLSKQAEEKQIPDFVPSRGWTSFDPKASVVVDTLFDPPKRISAEDAAHIPLREYAMLWRSYLGAVKDCLKDCRPEPSAHYTENLSPAEAKLKALLTERHGFLSWVAANNPSICHCLLTMDVGTDPPQRIQNGITSEKTREILEKMALTEAQAVFLMEARNQFLLSMGYHSAALCKLQEELCALDPNPKESVRNCHFLNWLHLARSLQETVEEMHVAGITFHCKMYKLKSGITPYQAAVLMIESYPYFPDAIALVSELATSKGAPAAKELFEIGRERFLANPEATQLKFVREPHAPVNSRIGKITLCLQQWESKRL